LYQNPWIYNGNPFLTDDIKDNYGFVYCITDTVNGKKYIGRKYFWSVRKVVGKRKKSKKESDWQDYYSSSEKLQTLLKEHGPERLKREILYLGKTKGQVNYTEIKYQFQLDVLETLMENGKRQYYNENIASRYFVPKHLKETE
jgi:hypothetical protein